MNKVVIMGIVFFSMISLAGCSSQNSKKANQLQSQNTLKLINGTDGDKTDKNGNYTLKMNTTKNSKITVFISTYSGKDSGQHFKVKHLSGHHFESVIHLTKKQTEKDIGVTARSKTTRKVSKDFLLTNNSSESLAYTKHKDSVEQSNFESESIDNKINSARQSSTDKIKSSSSSVKKKSQYPDVNTVFPRGILNYSDNQLRSTQFKLTGTVTDLGADAMKNYHILITGNDDNRPEYLLVISGKKTGKVVLNDTITFWGIAMTTSALDETQVNTGIGDQYKNTRVAVNGDVKM